MDTGRELDTLIAEKVMGFLTTVGGDIYGEGEKTRYIRRSVDDSWETTPCYSTDIAAAWQAVDKLRSLGWYLWLEDAQYKDVQYTASFILAEPMAEEYPWRSVPIRQSLNEASTAPHAICLAALCAVGYEVPQ